MTAPYLLTFVPILKEKVWGGRRLTLYGKPLPRGTLVGESWEVADLAETSASGGGGGEARSVIAAGAFAGRTLHDAMEAWGDSLLGRARPAADGGFPLLVKFLDAREHLSVQVHPSPEYAREHPGAHLKTECWYVLEADLGSVIYKGVKRGVSRADFERALRSGKGEGVVPLLEAVPAVPGECHNLPSGTVHALGAGVLVAEVQTPSDTTFRVYDWAKEYGRAGRELHVEQAMACIDFKPAPRAVKFVGEGTVPMASTAFYSVTAAGRGTTEVAGECTVVICAAGRIAVGDLRLKAGGVALVPASVGIRVDHTEGAALLVGLALHAGGVADGQAAIEG
ncbi:MAG: class I mannose-6-phosphate isomerase [Phycisphaeraceae bacterium]|nr:class I mannose-6-phosphate isomerase [Phycisphaeraceae bacterium]